jgi:uncharacterized protein YggE
MKTRNVVAFAAVGALLLGALILFSRVGGGPAFGQVIKDGGDKTDKRELTVSGTGTIRIKPDSARLFFTVESYAEQVRGARADNAVKVQRVMKALTDLKITNLKSKSDNITVQQLTDASGHQLPRIIGYRITNSFTVLVENEDRAKLSSEASRVLDAVLENGGTGVSQILFFKKGAEMEQLRREAMTKAVQDALANGRALLAGMDRTKLEPLTVSLTPQYHFPGGGLQNANFTQGAPGGGGEATASALVAGELEISCQVNMTCRY